MLPNILRRNRMPGLLDEFFGTNWVNDSMWNDFTPTVPAVNITEEKNDYIIELAAPGISKKDFKIDLNNNVLTISSESKQENDDKKDNYMRREFYYSSFSRSFSLPENIDVDAIKASQNDGILTVRLPKKQESIEKASKQINIS